MPLPLDEGLKPEEPVKLRGWADIDAIRDSIYDGALKAIQNRFSNLQNKTHRLELHDVAYADDVPDLRAEKKALLAKRSLGRRLKGTYRLVDINTGQVVSELPNKTVANIPHMTRTGTFIRNGNEYVINNQQRLRPGVFTRQKKSGDFESQFNVLPGTGRGFRLQFDPAKEQFRFAVGQGSVPAYPIFRAMGVSDEAIKASWGKELFERNKTASKSDTETVYKFANLMAKKSDGVTKENAAQLLPGIIGRIGLDPQVTERTLGFGYTNISPDVLVNSSKRLLGVMRGEIDPDERDSIDFQTFLGPEDFIRENLEMDAAGAARKLLWKSSFSGSLDKIPAAALNDNLDDFFDKSQIAAMLSQINPYETYDQLYKLTRLGRGGIANERSVDVEGKGVQPSHVGFIDGLRAPECYDEKTQVMTSEGWVFWKDTDESTKFACLEDGKLTFNKPSSLYKKHYEGVMYGAKSRHINYLVTPNHRMLSRSIGRLRSGKPSGLVIRTAEYVHDKNRQVMCSGHAAYEPVEPLKTFTLPDVQPEPSSRGCLGLDSTGCNITKYPELDIGDWLEFLGWYLSEGSVTINKQTNDYRVYISQEKTYHSGYYQKIAAVCAKLEFKTYQYDRGFAICGKQLATYMQQFGKSPDKFIPDYVWSCSSVDRRRLFDSLMNGDGRLSKDGTWKQTYTTTSERLAKDFEKLAFSLGYGTTTSRYVDNRKDTYLDTYEIRVSTRPFKQVCRYSPKSTVSDYYKVEDFSGMVYCATVPGGLLYVKREKGKGFWCGNSQRAGLDLRLAYRTFKGSDNQIYTEVTDVATGEQKNISAAKAMRSVVAFPGELKKKQKYVAAIKDGRMQLVDRAEVNYEIPYGEDIFSPLTVMNPFVANSKGQRQLMAARMTAQTVALNDPDARLVQAMDSRTNRAFDELFSENLGAKFAKKPGTVVGVGSDFIKVKGEDGTVEEYQLYDHHPFNMKGFMHNTPVVKVGDKVGDGQVIARSNYTDASGRAAYGKNLTMAFHTFGQDIHDDAIVISESAAQKLASDQIVKQRLDNSDSLDAVDYKRFRSLFPAKYSKAQLEKIDPETGMVKVGSTINYGDPLILGVGKVKPSAASAIMRQKKQLYTDASSTWDHEDPGYVVDSRPVKGGYQVVVKYKSPVKVADKLCYDKDTEVLTENGWKSVKSINAGEVVYSLNPDTHAIELVKTVACHAYAHEGRMYSVQTDDVDLVVTDNHKLYASCEFINGTKDFKLVEASHVFGLPYHMINTGRWEASNRGTLGISGKIINIHNFAELLGAYITGRKLVDVNLVSSVSADIEEAIINYLDSLYQDSADHIPEYVFKWSKAEILTLFNSLVSSSRHNYGYEFKTYSKKLADDFHRLCVHVSKQAEVSADETGRYVVSVIDTAHYLEVSAESQNYVDYNDYVYCVTLERNHVLLARRNGKAVWSGNSGFYGNKGIVSKIIPDEEMLRDEDGNIIDIVMNPAGLTSRVNPGQLIEANLGKVARKTGIPYTIRQFDDRDMLQFSRDELAKHGLTERQNLIDPKTGRVISNVYVGVPYVGKLHHMSEGKLSARGTGVYGSDFAPAKGGEEDFQSKKQGWLDVLSLVSHGATNYLKDKLIRGQRNDEFWTAFRLGQNPPMPRVYEPYERFMAYVEGAGAQIRKEGTRTHLFPVTDDAVKGRKLTSADTYDFNTMEFVPGGLFDPALTGGKDGAGYSYIQLDTKIPNPAIEAPLRTLLGLTSPEFMKILSGESELNNLKGPKAIELALQKINIDRELDLAKDTARYKSGTAKDNAIKKIKLLEMFKKYNLKPEQMMISKIQVIPPKYRPISTLNGTALVSDANYLYKEVFEANENFKQANEIFGDASEDTVNLYKATKGLFGMGDPVSQKNVERNVRGLLRDFVGKGSPKYGSVQGKVIGGTMDAVGRGVVSPDPSLGMDQVSLPNDLAFKTFEDFIIRKMVQNGYQALEAKEQVENRTAAAGKYLDLVLAERPIVLNRAPTLHKHNQIGLWAKRHEGSDIKVPLAPLTGLNMDFDGDSCRLYTVIQKVVDRVDAGATIGSTKELVMPFAQDTSVMNSEYETIHIMDFPRIEDSKVVKSYGFEYDVPAGTKIYAMDPETNEHKWYDVQKFSEHINLKCFLVNTSLGRTLVASEDHSLIVWNGSKLVKETPANSVGKFAPVTNFSNGPRLTEKTFVRPINEDNKKVQSETFQLNYNTGLFFGLLIGDGCVTNTGAVYLYGVNDKGQLLDKFAQVTASDTPFGDTACKISFESESIDGAVRAKSRMQIQNTRWLGFEIKKEIGDGSMNKKIPAFCLSAPDEHLVGILDGLISTDGSVSVSGAKNKPQLMISYATSSVDLVTGIRLLLSKLNVRSSVTKYKSQVSGNDAYMVTISTIGIRNLYDKGLMKGISHPTKDKVFKAYIGTVSTAANLTKDNVPYPADLDSILKAAYTDLYPKTTNAGKTYYGSLPSSKSKGFINRATVKELLTHAIKLNSALASDPEVVSFMSLINDENVSWDKVESAIECPQLMTAYDLTVEGPYTFATADGLIVQDTANIHVPITPEAIKDVTERMLPSKNLITPASQQIHMKPEQMALLGLYRATAPANAGKPPRVFNSEAEVVQAYSRGEIGHDDPVVIKR